MLTIDFVLLGTENRGKITSYQSELVLAMFMKPRRVFIYFSRLTHLLLLRSVTDLFLLWYDKNVGYD